LIIDGLRQRLMAPELVEEFIRGFHKEINLQRAKTTPSVTPKDANSPT